MPTGTELQFDDCKFALEMLAERHIVNVDDIDQLGELRVQLRDGCIGPRDDERNARHRRVIGRCNVQRLDVVAAARKHSGHAGECPDFVLEQYRDCVSHCPSILAK